MSLRVYVYDDLPYVRRAAAGNPAVLALLERLELALRAQPNVRLIEVAEQIDRLARTPVTGQFMLALAIGDAGARVARALHERTGWFPAIEVVPITRIEVGPGEYRIPDNAALAKRLGGFKGRPPAIVDDTIYSGLTLAWLLDRLPAASVHGAEVFCLQAMAAALGAIRSRCAVHAGFEMQGEPERDVTIIKASHLFEPGAIRRANQPDLAFFERSEWMKNWFPFDGGGITGLCRQLWALLV